MNRSFPIQFLRGGYLKRGAALSAILVIALLAFEVFNYSTTDFALTDVLGSDLNFLGIRWAVILSVAFCGIDFAGIARLFTPEQGADEPAEVRYLFGAWVLAAAMNATLTWWGVAVAIRNHTSLGSAIIGRDTLLTVVPVFVAVMVWVIRILLIGTFSMAGERLFAALEEQPRRPAARYNDQPARPAVNTGSVRPAPKPTAPTVRPEPSYHPLGMAAKGREDEQGGWR